MPAFYTLLFSFSPSLGMYIYIFIRLFAVCVLLSFSLFALFCWFSIDYVIFSIF